MIRKSMPNTPEAHIAEQAEKIAKSHMVIQDLDCHIANNNLTDGEKLVFRFLRNGYVDSIRFDLRLKPLVEVAKDAKKNPSLLYLFRNETGKTLAVSSLVLIGSYVILRMLEILFGLEALVKPLLP